MAQESYQCSECSGAFDVDWGGCGYRNQCAAWQGDLDKKGASYGDIQ
jgi:hypothetical protein